MIKISRETYEYEDNVHISEQENNSQFRANIVVLIRNTINRQSCVQGGKGLLEWNEFDVVIRVFYRTTWWGMSHFNFSGSHIKSHVSIFYK